MWTTKMKSLSYDSKYNINNVTKFVSSLRTTVFKKKIYFMVQMFLLEIIYVVQLHQNGKVSGFW